MSNCKIIGYIPEVDLVRFRSGEKIYNIDGDVIADLWNAYVEGHGGNYDICADCDRPEPKHGRWRHYEGTLTCSECHAEIYDDIMELLGDDVPRYCPNCGAKMDAPEAPEDPEP